LWEDRELERRRAAAIDRQAGESIGCPRNCPRNRDAGENAGRNGGNAGRSTGETDRQDRRVATGKL